MPMRRLIVLFGLAALFSAPVAASNLINPSTARSGDVYFKVKSPVVRGQLGHVTVQGRIGLCRITVSKGGIQMRPSTRVNPLRPKLSTARNDGRVAWQWWTPTNTALGRWQVRVHCGHAAPLHGSFLVTR